MANEASKSGGSTQSKTDAERIDAAEKAAASAIAEANAVKAEAARKIEAVEKDAAARVEAAEKAAADARVDAVVFPPRAPAPANVPVAAATPATSPAPAAARPRRPLVKPGMYVVVDAPFYDGVKLHDIGKTIHWAGRESKYLHPVDAAPRESVTAAPIFPNPLAGRGDGARVRPSPGGKTPMGAAVEPEERGGSQREDGAPVAATHVR